MAISGWFHIPQVGEDGYAEGGEEELAKNSSLMQLRGSLDQYDRPTARPVDPPPPPPPRRAARAWRRASARLTWSSR